MADKTDLDKLRESLRPGFSKGALVKPNVLPEGPSNTSFEILEGIIQLSLTVNNLASEMVKLKESIELLPKSQASSAEVLSMLSLLTTQQNSFKDDIAKLSSQLGYSLEN